MSGIADYLKECESLFDNDDVFVAEEEPFESGLAYLESMPNLGGGSCEAAPDNGLDYDQIGGYIRGKRKNRYVTVGEELRKTGGCMQTALSMRGKVTRKQFLAFIKCWRWLCPDCGSDGGRIHNKRVHRVLKRIGAMMDGLVFNLRQTVFTLPVEVRQYFMSPKDLTALSRMAERVHKKVVSESQSIRYLHCFGEKNRAIFSPHVNIHAFETEDCLLKLTPEKLKQIKFEWARSLKAYLWEVYKVRAADEVWQKIDVHYSFVEGCKEYRGKKGVIPGVALIIHRIKYMCRLHPGFANLDAIKDNEGLLRLFVCEMKGFHYITNCGSWKIKDCDRKEEMKEMTSLAGEPLELDLDKDKKIIYYTKAEVELKFRPKEMIELSEGFYRIDEMRLEKKKGKKNEKRNKKAAC